MATTDDLAFRFSVDEEGSFEGHAVIYGEQNRHRELYQPGAFRRSLAEHKERGSSPPMLWAHDQAQVIGYWPEIREDAKGLFVRGRLLLDVAKGREVSSMIRSGAVNGLSIGFSIVRSRLVNGTRTLFDVDLAEISVVAVPSAGRARIANYRNQQTAKTDAFLEACRKATHSMRQK